MKTKYFARNLCQNLSIDSSKEALIVYLFLSLVFLGLGSAVSAANDNTVVKLLSTPSPLVLSAVASCKDFIHTHCDKISLQNNFDVLDCIQNVKRQDNALNHECQNVVYQYKLELTKDDRFGATAKQICSQLLSQHKECQIHPNQQGQLLNCLMEFTDNTTDESCRSFLNKMETIIFSDYNLIYNFVHSCQKDISTFKCGRLSTDTDQQAKHSQGETIECLSKQSERLQGECRQEILRIAELQSDDFHLDRPLYFACRDDRERFCARVLSGEGRVYRCLMRHKLDNQMSRECREKLFQREKLIVQDYKVNRGLAKACREDIKMYHCRDDTSDRREFRLAQILLCLENAIRRGYPVAQDCKVEMKDHRTSLMTNYKLTPDLAAACEMDIHNFCKHLEGGGKTIHCLMAHAKTQRKGNRKISDKCRREVEILLKEVDIGESWRVDPVLQEACQPVVDIVCDSIVPGEGRMLSCLMDHIDATHMSDTCRDILLQIQYFVSRDFKLDFILYKACHKDAMKQCHAKNEWHDKPGKMDPERGPIVLPCLYRYAYHPDQNVRLSRECLYELKRVMRQRAISVNLHPEIEEPCLEDLSKYCSENIEGGQELVCLQHNMKDLVKDCKEAVANYTEEEAEHLELNYPLYRACESLLDVFCKDLRTKDVDQGDLLQCLITHKNSLEMKNLQKCRVAVEHFQLISLKDYRFSFKFKEKCKKDVITYCKTVKTKSDVVACLSSLVMNDTVSGRHNRISKDCRSQLKAELLERAENIQLDPILNNACKDDQRKFCKDVNPGESQVRECLKDHQRELQPECHRIIFNREQEEMQDNSVDYALMTSCKAAIKQFCPDSDMTQIFYCLKEKRSDPSVDAGCRKLILKRLLEQSLDFRLNPRLRKACIQDIPKFCSKITEQEVQDELFEGKVIACLKKEYRKSMLSPSCDVEVLTIMRESGWNVQLDAQLIKACSNEIREMCRNDNNNVEECLKIKFQEKRITNLACMKELARLIQEGKADIHSDPLLYKVCVQDIKHYCSDVPAGHGRQLSCLLAMAESASVTLVYECKMTLAKRMEMFEYAAQVAPIESIDDLIRQVTASPSRNYFIVLALGFLGVIFIGGLFCGRISKRVAQSTKNK